MTNISCDIIKDLLPLYYDKICSDESNLLVEEHLAGCNNCQNELEKIKTDICIARDKPKGNNNDSNTIRKIAVVWKQSKIKALAKGIIIATVVFTIIILGYIGLFKWNIVSVPTDAVEITDICKLQDGRIAYHLKMTDGYALKRIRFEMDESGNFYLIPLRPVIKEKAQLPYAFEDGYDFFNIEGQEKNHNGAEITALYYGTKKDKILIWKKGMDLPTASKEIEKMLTIK